MERKARLPLRRCNVCGPGNVATSRNEGHTTKCFSKKARGDTFWFRVWDAGPFARHRNRVDGLRNLAVVHPAGARRDFQIIFKRVGVVPFEKNDLCSFRCKTKILSTIPLIWTVHEIYLLFQLLKPQRTSFPLKDRESCFI